MNKPDEFLKGYLAVCQFLVVAHGQDTMAEQALTESGYSLDDVLEAQKKTGFHTRRMNKIIKNGFRRSKNQR